MLNTILNNITGSILLGDRSSSNTTTTTNFLSNLSELGLYGLHRNATSATGIGGMGDAVGSMGGGGTVTAANNDVPQIPDYIRYTSMVFCIVIMCLGVIGNIMVSFSFIYPLGTKRPCFQK